MTYFALENKIRQENEKFGTETLSSHISSQRYACDDAYLFFIGKLWQEDGWASERQPMASCQAWFSNISLAKIALSKGAAAGNVSSSAAEASSCIIIPASLIQLGDDNSNFVWVDEGGKAVRRTIVCGEYMSNGGEHRERIETRR